MSLARSTMNTKPSSSMRAMSPVLNQPSTDRLGGGVGAVEVALDDVGAAHAQLADRVRAGRQVVAVLVDELGVEARHDRAARRRLGEEEAGAVGRHDAVGLGEPVAGRRRAVAQRLVDLLDEVGLQRGAAAAHATQRRRVALRPVGVGDQLAAHRRHAGEVRHALALDQLERPRRVPLVREHDLAAGQRARVQQAVAGGDVEQRRRRHEHGDLPGPGGGRRGRRTRRRRSPWPRPSAVVMAQNTRCKMLCTEPRWVSWAPFGKPVVPDV